MSKVFILARDYGEAKDIAYLAGLVSQQEWQYMVIHSIRDHRGVPLLMTGDHCWRDQLDHQEARGIYEAIMVADCKITWVPCPPEWRDSGFTLPKGWDEPKTYPMYYQFGNEPKTKPSWWRRTRNAVWAWWR